ncbi:hypothetical protein IAU60_005876 [Kwoniella sp. DSM 27419]
MPSHPKILLLGATGYIGGEFSDVDHADTVGTLLVDLLKRYDPENITVLVRGDAGRTMLQPFGVKVVTGDRDDAVFLGQLAKDNDVVINCSVPFGGGDASIQALVDGLEQRAGATGAKPVLLQTSGTGSIMYGNNGEAGTDEWKPSPIAPSSTAVTRLSPALPTEASSRPISSCLPPSMARAPAPVTIPAYVRYAKRTGRAAYVGKGDNVWGNDLADLYLILMDHSLANPKATQGSSYGWSNLIYAGLDQHTWGPIITLIGDRLHARGEVAQPGAISIEDGQGDLYMFGTNSFMAVSEKAKSLGWTRKQPVLSEAIHLALPVD